MLVFFLIIFSPLYLSPIMATIPAMVLGLSITTLWKFLPLILAYGFGILTAYPVIMWWLQKKEKAQVERDSKAFAQQVGIIANHVIDQNIRHMSWMEFASRKLKQRFGKNTSPLPLIPAKRWLPPPRKACL